MRKGRGDGSIGRCEEDELNAKWRGGRSCLLSWVLGGELSVLKGKNMGIRGRIKEK